MVKGTQSDTEKSGLRYPLQVEEKAYAIHSFITFSLLFSTQLFPAYKHKSDHSIPKVVASNHKSVLLSNSSLQS